ncbi:hypothetical protein HGQ17_10565 [Nesterenkonia sp. MY13]|uniref:Uncharacterized protein n=1 Tax=Nesterenkonia sedimenti TaxID=1463632 RepID=A0A7X8TKV5_9MICC|nr:hypothetical protein [Nesterenkonia sedimenti]NLS10424.1 hypothetical protein [Nesterenkonia sedimenti]
MPQEPAGNGGGKKKTGLIVGLSVGAVALIGGTAALIWFLTSGDDYPDRPLTIEEIENLYPQDGEGVPGGYEPTGQGNLSEGTETWGDQLDSLENNSWFEDQADEMRDLIGEVDGAEACVDAIEAQHEFQVELARDMDPDMLISEVNGYATFASDDTEIDVYISTFEDVDGVDTNPWLERVEACEPVQAEQMGEDFDLEVIEEGDIQGYASTRDDYVTVILYSTYGDHIDVEYYATSDSMDADALEEDVREFMEMVETELAEIED